MFATIFYLFVVKSNKFSISKANALTTSSGKFLNDLSKGFVKNKEGLIPFLYIDLDIKNPMVL